MCAIASQGVIVVKIVVVLPTYNEADNIMAMTNALLGLPLDLSIIIVDDKSPDGT
ncbi:MAG: glycosyltransferase, partial [Ardenticatenaceae bacterium]